MIISPVHSETYRFAVSGAPHLIVKHDTGAIHVNSSHTPGEVTITTTGWNVSTRELPAIPLRCEQSSDGSTLTVTLEHDQARGLFPANLDITVPRAAHLSISTRRGDIWVTGVQGKLSLHSEFGVISVSQGKLCAGSHIEARTGTINFHEDIEEEGTYEFVTGSGSINMIVPENAPFHLEAESETGIITTNKLALAASQEAHTLRCDSGRQPRASIILRSGSGAIHCDQRSPDSVPLLARLSRFRRRVHL